MSDTIVKLYQKQSFVIGEDILKAIKKNNLTLDEALLIIYFCSMNKKAVLDIEEISTKFGMEEMAIMRAFASLTEKNLVNIKMQKNRDNIMEEIIDLTPLYQSIAMGLDTEKRESNVVKVFQVFESEFGRPLSSMETSIINNWLDRGVSEELISGALKEATFNGTLTLRYIDAIISEWNRKGLKTMEDVNIHLKKKKDVKLKSNRIEVLFDYDWLNDTN